MKSLNIINGNLKDLNPRGYGYDHCPKGRIVGPKAVNYTIIHYIESGKGTLKSNGETYEVLPGHAFVIRPGEITTYKADEEDPWFYRHISFDGELSRDFAKLPTVFETTPDYFREICAVDHIKGRKESMLASILFRWHSEICQDTPILTNEYVETIKNYIEENYMLEISIENLAKKLNVSHSYLVRVFKKSTGQTIQEYILSTRLKQAKLCLEGEMNVTEAAYSCGFSDVSNFSKQFKRYIGLSPKRYKESLYIE